MRWAGPSPRVEDALLPLAVVLGPSWLLSGLSAVFVNEGPALIRQALAIVT
jgi:hypothetical protein